MITNMNMNMKLNMNEYPRQIGEMMIHTYILTNVSRVLHLIQGMFSGNIFATNERSWVIYVASVVPTTLLTVAIGLGFLEREKIMQLLFPRQNLMPKNSQRVKEHIETMELPLQHAKSV